MGRLGPIVLAAGRARARGVGCGGLTVRTRATDNDAREVGFSVGPGGDAGLASSTRSVDCRQPHASPRPPLGTEAVVICGSHQLRERDRNTGAEWGVEWKFGHVVVPVNWWERGHRSRVGQQKRSARKTSDL